MFFLIPFSIFVVSVVLIGWIVGRKFVYLKKLTPEVLEGTVAPAENFWAEMFPEIASQINKIELRAFGVRVLNEFEKLLRKTRLISLKIDDLTNRLIHRVRKSTKAHTEILSRDAALAEEKEEEIENSVFTDLPAGSPEELKQQEQLLILEIAKNPKDPVLYNKLGNIYMRIGEYEDAKNSFEKVLEIDPGNEGIKHKLERVKTKMGAK